MEGFLYKKSTGILSKWQKRYFCVDETGVDYLRENETEYNDRFAGTHIDLESICSVELTKEGFSILFHNGKISQLKGPPNTSREYIKDWVRVFHNAGCRTKGLENEIKRQSELMKQQAKNGWGSPTAAEVEQGETGPVVVHTDDTKEAVSRETADMASAPENARQEPALEPGMAKTDELAAGHYHGGADGHERTVTFRPQMSVGVDYQHGVVIKVWEDTQAFHANLDVGDAMVAVNGAAVPTDDEDLQGLLVSLVRGTEEFEITFRRLNIKELAARGFHYKTTQDMDDSEAQLPAMDDEDGAEGGDGNAETKEDGDGNAEKKEDDQDEDKYDEEAEEADVEAMLQSSVDMFRKKRADEMTVESTEADSSLDMVLGMLEESGDGDLMLDFSSDEDDDEDDSEVKKALETGELNAAKTTQEDEGIERDYKYANITREIDNIKEEEEGETAPLPITQKSLGLDEETEDVETSEMGAPLEEEKTDNALIDGAADEDVKAEAQKQASAKTEVDPEVEELKKKIREMKTRILQKAKEALMWKQKTEKQAKSNKEEFAKLKKTLALKKQGKSAKIAEKNKILALLVKNFKICKEKMILIRKKARSKAATKRKITKGI
mmetsp:Transcript_25382/g.61131  ORF Transcript_25382/g.61131 Transcript_25382/m.61131 type:complete len:610 (-) Transcript_25382:242-2071(-)|eukprot:CAMPEP_0114517342 /NCGR_PEP_ID=MMETSP0109-20121206/17837_1 /TAXON_ID=29199 /ORGANISM="Chlorarachnion reptans, Strain CCCM449" /LENGTH=609 /DNA_ID=CAMNT_0001697845 /DNA_START=44 /DNA_END=1873 /DNA_ORIENTATION=-